VEVLLNSPQVIAAGSPKRTLFVNPHVRQRRFDRDSRVDIST
jgi:hypothetical protein